MLDIYICEDNENQLKYFASHISDYCIFQNLDAEMVLASPNPGEILAHYSKAQNPALFFIDIELKAKINGIELAGQIREKGKKAFIVFITIHSELTLLTFQYKVEALDFIIKDNQDNIKRRITECINIAYKRHMINNKDQLIRITVDDKIIFLDMEEIIFIETTKIRHKLRLHTKNGL